MKQFLAVLGLILAALFCAGCKSSLTAPAASDDAVLSIGQARDKYLEIIDPNNVVISRYNTDVTSAKPWRVVRADLEAVAAADQKADGQLLAVRWPTVVRPWVIALAITEGAAAVNCDSRMASSGSQAAADQLWISAPECVAVQDPQDQDQVRELLGLPPAR